MAAPVIPAIREWLWLVGMPIAHAAAPQTMMAAIAAARAMSAASLSPPKSTMPKMVLATAVLTIVMRTMPIKLQAAAMMIAGPGRIARVPTTVAIALGASVAPLTTVAPRQSSMMTPRIGFAAIAPTTASAFISKVSPPIAFQMQKRC